MKLTQLALAAALILPATYAAAHEVDTMRMTDGLSMIERNVAGILEDNDIDVDPRSLTLAQLVEIAYIVDGPDAGSGGTSVRSDIESALGRF